MAEIDIQKKRKSPWPWILGGLAAALALWGIARVIERPERRVADVVEEAVPPPAEMPRTEAPAGLTTSVQRFAATAAGFATAEAGELHNYVGGALGQLGTVLHSLASGTPHESGVGRHLDDLRRTTQQIEGTAWTPETNAEPVKSAFTSASGAISELQRGQPGNADLETHANAVHQAAEAIEGSRPVLDQRAGIQTFLTSAARAVEGLASSR